MKIMILVVTLCICGFHTGQLKKTWMEKFNPNLTVIELKND